MAINPEIHTFIHHLHVRRSLLDQPWMTKLQHLQTIQTCHCHRMPGKYGKVTSWHAAAFSDSAEPIPHTRPWRPRHQCRWKSNRCSWRTHLSSVPRPRPGGSDKSRLASCSWALPSKPDHWNPANNWHSTETCRISLIYDLEKHGKTIQKSTVSFSIYIFADNSTRSKMNDKTIAPPKRPNFTVKGCRESMGKLHHDMPQHSAEPIPHTRPWHPQRQSGWIPNRCSWRTTLSSAPRPRPGKGDRARLASSSRALPFKSWTLKSGEHVTFNSDMWISLIQNLANNAEIDSCLQRLHIRQLSLRWKMNDETTAPPNHPNLSLSKDVENIWKQKHSAVGSTVKTWSLKSWEQIYANMKQLHLTQTCESLWCET